MPRQDVQSLNPLVNAFPTTQLKKLHNFSIPRFQRLKIKGNVNASIRARLSSSLYLTVILSTAQGTEPSISDCIEVLLSGKMLWFKGTIFVKIKQNSWNCVDFEKCFIYFTHQPQFPSFLPLFWSLQPPSPNTSIIHSSERMNHLMGSQ